MSGLEIPGLIAAVGELTALGLSSARKLHEVKTQVSKYADQAHRLRQHIESMVRLLQQVERRLAAHASRGAKDDQLVRDINASLSACKTVLQELQDTAQTALSEPLQQSLFRRLKYAVFTESQVRDYCDELTHCSVALLGYLALLAQDQAAGGYRSIIGLLESIRGVSTHNSYFQRLDELEQSLICEDGDNMEDRNIAGASPDASQNRETTANPAHREVLPTFTFWLGRRDSTQRERPWMYTRAPVSAWQMHTFISKYSSSFTDHLNHLDGVTVRVLCSHLDSHRAEAVAIKILSHSHRLRRFLRPRLLSIDLASKPESADEPRMRQALRDGLGFDHSYTYSSHPSYLPPTYPPSSAPNYYIEPVFPWTYLLKLLQHQPALITLATHAREKGFLPDEYLNTLCLIERFIERWQVDDLEITRSKLGTAAGFGAAKDIAMELYNQAHAQKGLKAESRSKRKPDTSLLARHSSSSADEAKSGFAELEAPRKKKRKTRSGSDGGDADPDHRGDRIHDGATLTNAHKAARRTQEA